MFSTKVEEKWLGKTERGYFLLFSQKTAIVHAASLGYKIKLSIIIVTNSTFALLSVGRSAREGMHYTAWEEEEGFLFLLLPSAYTIITEGHSDESIHIFIHSVILSNLSNIYT